MTNVTEILANLTWPIPTPANSTGNESTGEQIAVGCTIVGLAGAAVVGLCLWNRYCRTARTSEVEPVANEMSSLMA